MSWFTVMNNLEKAGKPIEKIFKSDGKVILKWTNRNGEKIKRIYDEAGNISAWGRQGPFENVVGLIKQSPNNDVFEKVIEVKTHKLNPLPKLNPISYGEFSYGKNASLLNSNTGNEVRDITTRKIEVPKGNRGWGYVTETNPKYNRVDVSSKYFPHNTPYDPYKQFGEIGNSLDAYRPYTSEISAMGNTLSNQSNEFSKMEKMARKINFLHHADDFLNHGGLEKFTHEVDDFFHHTDDFSHSGGITDFLNHTDDFHHGFGLDDIFHF